MAAFTQRAAPPEAQPGGLNTMALIIEHNCTVITVSHSETCSALKDHYSRFVSLLLGDCAHVVMGYR